MSRHRNVRSMNYSDEYDGYDDVYGHSVEDDYTISPSDAAFMYDRNRQPQMSAYLNEEDDIAEEDETGLDDSMTNQRTALNEVDEARLRSCLDEIRNVIGDTVTEHRLVSIILKNEFDISKSLDEVLSTAASSKHHEDSDIKRQREKKDTGKDQDDHTTPVNSETEQIKLVQDGLAQLALGSVRNTTLEELDSASSSGATFRKTLPSFKVNSSRGLGRHRFPHKGICDRGGASKENVSDEDDEENSGSLSSLMAQHQKKALASTNTYTSLADRANQYLKANPLVQKIPRDDITTNTTFPNLSHIDKPTTNLSLSNNLSNLSQCEGKVGNKFVIPKLGLLKRVPSDNQLQIDLSSALKPATDRRARDNSRGVERTVPAETEFVDDRVLERLSVLHRVEEFDCAANARNIRDTKVPRQKALSSFGRVLCGKWIKRGGMQCGQLNNRGNSFKQIQRFDFKSPSPDDMIRKYLRKK